MPRHFSMTRAFIHIICFLASAIVVASQTLEGCKHSQFSLSATSESMIGACGDLVMTGRQLRGRVVITGPRSFDVHRFEVTAGAALTWWAAESLDAVESGTRLSSADVTVAHAGSKLSVTTTQDLPPLLVLWDMVGKTSAGHLWMKSPGATIQTFLANPTYMENCKQLAPNIRLRWTAGRERVDFGLEASIADQRYLSFGPAKPGATKSLMGGSDVAVMGYSQGVVFIGDYYITNYEECNANSPVEELRGVCEDRTWGAGDASLNDLSVLYAHQQGGVTFVRYSRQYVTSDARFDHALSPNASQTFIWATGAFTSNPSNQSRVIPRFHGNTEGVDFGAVSLVLHNVSNSSSSSNATSLAGAASSWDCPALTQAPVFVPSKAPDMSNAECLGDAGDGFEAVFGKSAQLDTGGRLRLFWNLCEGACADKPSSSSKDTVTFALRVSKNVPERGYVSFGIGEGMANAACYVAWIDGGGVGQVVSYYMDTYQAAGMLRTGEVLKDVSVRRNNAGGLSVRFTREVKPSSTVTSERAQRLVLGAGTDGTTPFIWALGPIWHDPPLESDIHTERSPGAVRINLSSGSMTGQEGMVREALVAHAACMCIAWLVLAPLGVMAARYLRNDDAAPGGVWFWLNAHQVLMWCAVAVMLAGVVLAVQEADRAGKPHLRSAHAKLGVSPLALLIVQIMLGLYQAVYWNGYVRIAHRLLSLVMLALVVACLITGVQELIWQFAIPQATLTRTIVAVVVWILTLCALAAWREVDRRRQVKLLDALAGVDDSQDDAEGEKALESRPPEGAADVGSPQDIEEGAGVMVVRSMGGKEPPKPTASLAMWGFSASMLGFLVLLLMSLLASNVFTPVPKVLDRCSGTDGTSSNAVQSADAQKVQGKYPGCKAFPLEHVGDGWCDAGAAFNSEECGWDAGDCCKEATGLFDCKDPSHRRLGTKSPTGAKYPAPRNPRYSPGDRGLSDYEVTTGYNNFYEFSFGKAVASHSSPAAGFLSGKDGWPVEIGGLVGNPRTIDVKDLMSAFQMEERAYRHRCVEGWSIAAPWVGFPVSHLVEWMQPKPGAKYIKFTSFLNTKVSDIQKMPGYPWPYVEALTIEEAMNELAFIAVGAYQEPLTSQMGPPIRLVVPWKYGFKSVKSISKIELVEAKPLTFWEDMQASEYGFWANVNPKVSHPRWSQATERWLKTNTRGDGTLDTVIYNGYEPEVGYLYTNLTGERLFA